MDRTGLLTLSHYNAYANHLVLDTATKLTPEQLERESSPSHGSVYKLLAHMFSVEEFFLSVCQEQAPLNTVPDTLPILHNAWSNLETARTDYLTNATDADLASRLPVRFCDPPLLYTADQLILQSLLHSTHHRGELSIVLTGLGHPLPTLDIILQFTAESGQRWPD